jgi:hypothetical protein
VNVFVELELTPAGAELELETQGQELLNKPPLPGQEM